MATRVADIKPSIKDQVSAEEWAVRQDLACAYRLVAHYGWDDLIFTHLSAAVPGPDEHFLINPFGLMFEEVTASNLVKVDIHGTIILSDGYGINPAGYTIHSCIHEARKDVGSVMHTHTVAGVAVSAQKDGLLPISQTALGVFNDTRYHDYEGIALNPEEKPRLVADLGSSRTLILRNHGLLSCGKSVAEAFLALFFLEKACAIQLAAQGANADLIQQPQGMADLVQQQSMYGFDFAADMSWQGLKRKMQRLDASFMN
jgi:ribulose-5-phosphate 4-epimerase/fuculose-1-phosphate aldolase